jgi:hypothetical protein
MRKAKNFRTMKAAWHEATITAGQLFKNIDGKFRPGQKWSLEISDENDNSLFYRHPRWER